MNDYVYNGQLELYVSDNFSKEFIRLLSGKEHKDLTFDEKMNKIVCLENLLPIIKNTTRYQDSHIGKICFDVSQLCLWDDKTKSDYTLIINDIKFMIKRYDANKGNRFIIDIYDKSSIDVNGNLILI